MASSTFPPCYGSQAEFDAFEDEARELEVRPVGYSYCHGCSPAYQALSLSRKRCMHPETRFMMVADEDGELYMAGIREAYLQQVLSDPTLVIEQVQAPSVR